MPTLSELVTTSPVNPKVSDPTRPDEIDIIEIGVIKQQRRRGVAYKLVSHFQKHCINNGIRKIFLCVAENNIAAISLYEKTGFNKIGIRKNYYFRDGFLSDSYEYSWKVKS